MPDIPAASIIPYLCVRGAVEAIAHYRDAFGATEEFKQLADDGKRIMHATLRLFGSRIYLCDEFPEYALDVKSPSTLGAASTTMHINFATPAEVDAAFKQAEAAGCVGSLPPSKMFWGDYYGRLRDKFGHVWSLSAPG
jgi:PhnB protein